MTVLGGMTPVACVKQVELKASKGFMPCSIISFDMDFKNGHKLDLVAHACNTRWEDKEAKFILS